MRHWSQIGIRNWRVKPGRTAGGLAAIALGVGVVIWVTCAYESVRLALQDQVWLWTGRSHLSVESVSGPEGTINQSLSQPIARLGNVQHVTSQLRYRALAQRVDPAQPATKETEKEAAYEVSAIGIDPGSEPFFRQYDASRVTGRTIRPGETGAAMIEHGLAANLGLKAGDTIYLVQKTPDILTPGQRRSLGLRIVGLLEHRRVAKQQLPVVVAPLDQVQQLAGYDQEPRKVSKIDIILAKAERADLQSAERQIRLLVGPYGGGVRSAEAKINQVRAAEQQTSFVLLLISTVALFTAFFVILSTLSMGMVERIGQLGTLRCLGTTRLQLAAIVLAEAAPLGITGILLGVPVGFALAKLSVILVPQYIGQFAVSPTGVMVALIGGAVTTLIGTVLPMLQAMRVSPLSASRPQARAPRAVLDWVTGVIGAAMIIAHSWMVRTTVPTAWFEQVWGSIRAISVVVLLYCGYALVTPLLVRLVGHLAVYVAAGVLGVRHRLLSDQVGRATWRSAAICCGLMVGLSLIVSLVVHSKSLAAGWDFPKDFCEAFVHVAPPVPRQDADRARRVPGAGKSAIVNVSTQIDIYGRGFFRFPFSRFISGSPEEFFNIAKLEFLQGTKDEAVEKLKRGGCILVTPEFTRSQGLGYGDKVRIAASNDSTRAFNFEIVGVVTSPALDIAANYFNAGGMLASQSAYVVLGTQADLVRYLRAPDAISMFLLDFDLPETPPPPEFRQDEGPWDIWQAAPFARRLESWAGQLPERAGEIATIRRQLAAAQAWPSSRPESELPVTGGGGRGAGDRPPATAPSEPTLKYADVPMLDLFKRALGEKVYPDWAKLSPADRWRTYREELVLRLVPRRAGAADDQHASVRALKIQIDRDLGRATMIFTAIPMVALIVAALGVGNLMMANVSNRTRQLAMLRAVGATKSQITRLIIGEAIVLGALGSVMGVMLGLNAAIGLNHMTEAIWGFRPSWTIPWTWVTAGIGFTLGVCLIAGIIPARHAARSNIIDALQTT